MSGAVLAAAGADRRRGPWRRLALTFALIVLALAGFVAWSWIDAQRYPVENLARAFPARTALMAQRAAEAERTHRRFRVDQRWVGYDRVAPVLRRAVLVAEDDAFFVHGGFDWNEINAAMKANLVRHRVVRGGSTITQQLARNLFLGDQRTPARKLTEAFLAMRLERSLDKRRIFELYLNLIEWGDGVFGIEAAARHYFHVPAAALDPRQSVLLAAVIINPRRFSVLDPSRRIARRARIIASRLRRRGALDIAQYERAIDAPAGSLMQVAPSPPAVSMAADSSLVEPDLGTNAPAEPAPTPAIP